MLEQQMEIKLEQDVRYVHECDNLVSINIWAFRAHLKTELSLVISPSTGLLPSHWHLPPDLLSNHTKGCYL